MGVYGDQRPMRWSAIDKGFAREENMLFAPERKSFAITSYETKNNGVYFYSKDFTLRVCPKEHNMFRISLTEGRDFSQGQGEQLKEVTDEKFTVCEDEKSYLIKTGEAVLGINKLTGTVKAFDRDGSVLFSESDTEPRSLERFEAFRTKPSGAMKVEKIKTADGEKNRIIDSEMVSDGFFYRTKLSLKFEENEILLGLGQLEDGVWNLRGTTQYLNQANRKIVSPVLISNRGYGVFLTTQSTAIFRDDERGSYLYTEADEYMDYYLILQREPEEIVRGMRLLTGKARMLPKWAFGYLQSKERYETQQEILDVAAKFREKQLPVDALILDWMSWGDNLWGQKSFDRNRFPEPGAMIEKLHDMGIHFMMSIWPNMSENTDDHQAFKKAGQFLPGTGIYNAFSAEARAIYQKQIREQLLQWGVDSFWCDSSEPITPEWNSWFKKDPADEYAEYVSSVSKSIPIKYLNTFGLSHARTIYEELGKVPGKRVCNLTRSGYPGSQQYGVILWSGDTAASWETLQKQIVIGLSLTATGIPYWTFDIGAFFVKNGEPWYWRGDYPNGYEDEDYCRLYTRWFQLGAFLPVFRAHGTEIPREPWAIGAEDSIYYKALKKALEIRYSLMPYIYTLSYRVWANDELMMKPLCYAYPKDAECWNISDQYMFGPSLMVCPILTRENDRKVYFPKGQDFYDFSTGERYKGGSTVTIHKEIDEIPVFVPEDSLIPMCAPAQNTASLPDEIIIKKFGEGKCCFDLYSDDGDGYGYENGEFTIRRLV